MANDSELAQREDSSRASTAPAREFGLSSDPVSAPEAGLEPLATLKRHLERGFAPVKIAVVGDVIVDRFIWGSVSRISPEAPVPVVEVDRRRIWDGFRLGGAANVAHNVVRLGAAARLYGILGRDEAGLHCQRLLGEVGIESRVEVLEARPTTQKTRVVAHQQQVVRFDLEERGPMPPGALLGMRNDLMASVRDCQAVILSDYAKGVLDATWIPALIQDLRAHGLIVAVDPKVKSMDLYRGATVVTPNRGEACAAAGVDPETPDAHRLAARRLLERLQCDAVLVTLGDAGIFLLHREGLEVHVPTRAAEVYDVTGAGDTVVATLSVALAAGLGWVEAVELANLAAGVVVGKIGTATASVQELLAALALHALRRRAV